ncbi:MAG: hypothetical protein Q8942_08665, partial [Bacillota bacterium]|nr:hypothetical protein [Bacillota bacterium]
MIQNGEITPEEGMKLYQEFQQGTENTRELLTQYDDQNASKAPIELETGETSVSGLRENTETYLKSVLSKELRMPPDRIKSEETFEKYG